MMRVLFKIVGSLWLTLVLVTLMAPRTWGQGFSPEAAAARMKVPTGFTAKLVAAEPVVRQPVAIEFDDRGRLWVIQYLQYPNPAGLKRVKVDRFSRTVYDRVPEPPPRGPRGADRITILEDFDSNGRARKAKDFITGLNLASGIAFGHGGVFVLQAPYLLFYADKNGDDVPDGDPEVLLSGFGMEDASAVANSLTWGPDGWLYGCQGSTVTADIRGTRFQQGVWRYHPVSRRFELFSDGGGNAWGLDFDARGNLFYSTNFGGFVAVHGVQGGYYWKAFEKHGPLSNPYAYGYFDHVPHRNFRGGHVTVGGIIYQGDSFPERFRGTLIAADLLGHAVYWHQREPAGSTFRSRHGGELLLANDTWFAPTDLTMGPDGAVYVADWYDQRTAHPDPDAEWDRSNGRIYKIEAQGTRPYSGQDLTKLASAKLVELLAGKNDWYVRKARRILADRRDPEVIAPLRTLCLEGKDDRLALQALWALYVSGGFDDAFAEQALAHRCPDVRSWTVRLLGDNGRVSPKLVQRLSELARMEPDVTVRSQLACTARRLPAPDGLPIVWNLLRRDQDGRDAYLPLLLWWAVERHALSARSQVLKFFTSTCAWRSSLSREAILGRLMRRFAAEGTAAGSDACARLLASAPGAEARKLLIEALDHGLQDRRQNSTSQKPGFSKRPGFFSRALEEQLTCWWNEDPSQPTLIRLMARLGHRAALDRARSLALDAHSATETRRTMLELLGEVGRADCVEPLLQLLDDRDPEPVQLAALGALQRFDRQAIASTLLERYSKLKDRVRSRAIDVLLSRKHWALALLERVDDRNFRAEDITVEQLRPVAAYQDPQLDALVRKHWGKIVSGTPEEKLAEIRRLKNDLRAGAGNPRLGRELFKKHCATCHRLFDEGERTGPDLTHANRKDQDYLLVSIVDPSAVIRKEYLSYHLQTTDGRLLTGLIVEQAPNGLTLVNANNERTTVARDQVESLRESAISLMPENLLRNLKPQECRDLFSYLQSEQPMSPGKTSSH